MKISVSSKKRIAALLLAAVMCFAVLSACLFICAEAGHICTGEDCSVCCQIAFCRNSLNAFAVALSVCAVVFGVRFAALSLRYQFNNDEPPTLVSLRIKLSY